MDEYQYEVAKKSLKTKVFETKEEANEWVDSSGKLWSNVKEVNGKWYRFYSRVGELLDECLTEAGESFNMPIKFRAAYDIGLSFAGTH